MNERALLVDDEPSVHEVVSAYLEREGFHVPRPRMAARGYGWPRSAGPR